MIQIRERPGRAARARGSFLFGASPSGGGGASDEVVSFGAFLQTSLVPWVAFGSYTPTFSRASTAYVLGYASGAVIADDPVLLLCASGEARFMGARRVSEGVWSGADANGVALTTTNGASALCCDTSGLFGYLAEGARTNLALQSQTLDSAPWDVVVANMEAVAANQYVAPDGASTMDKLQTKATNASHYINQTFGNFTAAAHTYSIYLRYVNNRWAALRMYDSTDVFSASFDLLNGVVGAVSAGVTSTISSTALAGVYRVTMTATTTAGIGYVYVAINNTDTASIETWNAAGTELLGAWGAQVDLGSFASSYIPTTAAAVARAAEVTQYVSASNISATATSLTMQVIPAVALGSVTVFHWASYVDADNYTAILSDGTDLIARKRISGTSHDATIAWARTAGTVAKIGARFDTANGVDIFLNGAQGTADTTTTESQFGAAFQVGADGNGANQDYCEHRFFNAYMSPLSASRLKALTT